MTTKIDLPADKIIEVQRHQLDAANFQLAQMTAANGVLTERVVAAENEVTELKAQIATDTRPGQ